MGDLCSSLKAFSRAVDFYEKMLSVNYLKQFLSCPSFSTNIPPRLESPRDGMERQGDQPHLRLSKSDLHGLEGLQDRDILLQQGAGKLYGQSCRGKHLIPFLSFITYPYPFNRNAGRS